MNILSNFLVREEIVREVSRPGENRSWRLDHDYLCIPMIHLDKERNPWRHKLDAAYAAYEDATGLWKKYQALLSPVSVSRIFVGVVRGRFQLGSKRRFALLSLTKLVLSPILRVALGGGWIFWDNRIDAEAQQIVNGLGVFGALQN